MTTEVTDNNLNICAECKSEYYRHTSKMTNLCPECSHILYGYENCDHYLQNGRCVKCFWNGNVSEHLKKLESNKTENDDPLSRNMQDEVIKIASERLGHSLSDQLIAKVRQNKWSYMGLEMIIDSVKSLDIDKIENYLSKLD